MTPDVSVIIAAYNTESYIVRAAQSALASDGVTVEVVLVDDGSTDGTWAAMEAMNDPRLVKIRLAANLGPSGARMAGVAAATGRWLAVQDGDDTLRPWRLARCLARGETEQADIVVDNLLCCPEVGGAQNPMFAPARFARRGTLDLAALIEGNRSFLGGGEVLGYLKPVIRASFWKEAALAYDPKVRVGEDYLLLADALAKGARCVVEPSAGYLYTVRAGSISHRMTLESLTRIEESDAAFRARHTLAPKAARALQSRARRLADAFAFTRLVETLKNKAPAQALKILCARPWVLWYLWRPLAARFWRFFG